MGNRGTIANMHKKGEPCDPGLKERMSKPVLQFDLDGNFIREYKSTVEAGKVTGVSIGNISSVCTAKRFWWKGIRRQAGGFIWKYKYIIQEYVI